MGHRDLIDRVQRALSDRYTVITAVGRGGTASIYGARDTAGNPVAIKVLHPELSASVASDRFLREIRYAAELHHPRIAALIDSGESDYLLWYVMPYVSGDTLRQALNRSRRLPIGPAVRAACDVLDALAYAHARGFAHRDIKPENIVLGPQGAVVLDFGIARAIASSGEDRVTQSGFVVGTEVYMSPEQAGGAAEIDGRTDIYSLGIVLFELLAGRPPFTSPSAIAVLEMHQRQSAPELQSLRPEIPAPIAAVVARALAKAPADRWATAGDMRDALLPFAEPQ